MRFTHRIEDVDEFLGRLVTGTLRMGALIASQTLAVQARIRDAYAERLERWRSARGYDLPCAVKLGSEPASPSSAAPSGSVASIVGRFSANWSSMRLQQLRVGRSVKGVAGDDHLRDRVDDRLAVVALVKRAVGGLHDPSRDR